MVRRRERSTRGGSGAINRSVLSQSGEVELGALIPLVLVANVIVAIIAWYAVGALLQ
jgi:hypothetical protein